MRRLEVFLVSALGALSLLISCAKEVSVQPPTTALIKGRITDLATGSAVSDAYITTAPPSQSVRSDGAGNYQIEIAQPGIYVVSVSKVGYSSNSVSILTAAGKTTVADVGLTAGNSNNNNPAIPASPQPANLSSDQPQSLSLAWSCSDPDGDELIFDVYFGTSNPPSQLRGSDISATSLPLTGLDTGTTYYWFVLAKDSHGGMTPGPVWRFTTDASVVNPAGKALEFKAVGNYSGADRCVRASNAPQLNLSSGSFTVEAWVRPSGFRDWNWIVSKARSNGNADYLLGLENGKVKFHTRNTSNEFTTNIGLTVGTWYHLAGVQDISQGKLFIYVNGVLESQLTLSGNGVSTTGDLFIGAREDNGQGKPSEGFDGIIHDLRLWNKARSQSEISGARNRRLTGTESGLVGYWPLNDGSGSTVNDATGHGYAGTLLNSPQWVTTTTPVP